MKLQTVLNNKLKLMLHNIKYMILQTLENNYCKINYKRYLIVNI